MCVLFCCYRLVLCHQVSCADLSSQAQTQTQSLNPPFSAACLLMGQAVLSWTAAANKSSCSGNSMAPVVVAAMAVVGPQQVQKLCVTELDEAGLAHWQHW